MGLGRRRVAEFFPKCTTPLRRAWYSEAGLFFEAAAGKTNQQIAGELQMPEVRHLFGRTG
jgi:hypothetical protein